MLMTLLEILEKNHTSKSFSKHVSGQWQTVQCITANQLTAVLIN